MDTSGPRAYLTASGLRSSARPFDVPAVRWGAGFLILAYALVLEVGSVRHGSLPTLPVILTIGAVAFIFGRFGRTIYYLLPTLLGFGAYIAARSYVTRFKLTVHYLPQIRIDQHLLPGPIPTVWLQEHLYHGHTGPLEIFSMVFYVSHFFVPLALGAALVLSGRTRAFALLMFGILTCLFLGEIVFVLLPTAPPWLAAEHGYLPGVHHILKQTFADVHLTQLASMSGNESKYDVTAAVPSLHVAFPVVCLLTVVHARLSRLVAVAFALNVLAVSFAIVYMGEHYVFDALTGALLGVGSWLLVRRLQAWESPSRGRSGTAEAVPLEL